MDWAVSFHDQVAAVEQLVFNYKGDRAAKARLARRLDGSWLLVLKTLVFVLLLAGISLLVSSLFIGWLVCGLAVLPAMVIGWYEGELKLLRPETAQNTVDAVL